MSSVLVSPGPYRKQLVDDVMYVRTSKDMLNWSEAMPIEKDGEAWGNHYVAIFNDDDKTQPYILTENEFSVLTNHNGTTVMRYPVKLIEK